MSNLSIPFIDTSNVLYTQSDMNFTYTATQNCIMCGTIESLAHSSATVYLNDVRVGGHYTTLDLTSSLFLPIKAGQTVRYESSKFNSDCPLHVFGIF